MKSEHAIIAFVDAHPIWKSVKSSLRTEERGEKQYIIMRGPHGARSEIGAVWMDGNKIYAESFFSYPPQDGQV